MPIQTYIAAIIVNRFGEVLLVQRSKSHQIYPNSWTLVGGKVQKGESLSQALARELIETLSINLNQINSVWLFHSHKQESSQHQLNVYIVHTEAELQQLQLKKVKMLTFSV